ADALHSRYGAAVAVSGSPRERDILDQVLAAARTSLIDLPRLGVDLRLLKSIIKLGRLMITNDTGPRHVAAAFGVPVLTIFGPTDPAWTRIDFPFERQVRVDVFCGPCQKKKCPLDHRCMKLVTPDMVVERSAELLQAQVDAAHAGRQATSEGS
ncbi:MAG: glycosyltransferase family 9 protein, partial [Phycisphaeraceae bacterium]|nr:glycosyltransferase family 9 protein [Phycisphaeraceae bacterium]